MEWKKMIPQNEIEEKVTDKTVKFAEDFGKYLGTDVKEGYKTLTAKLTTSQLRNFFGEVKRQQMCGFDETAFALLKPKLAYAVGRADKKSKIVDFYEVMSEAIDRVLNAKSEADQKKRFKNFIDFFEAIVAYHKYTVKD